MILLIWCCDRGFMKNLKNMYSSKMFVYSFDCCDRFMEISPTTVSFITMMEKGQGLRKFYMMHNFSSIFFYLSTLRMPPMLSSTKKNFTSIPWKILLVSLMSSIFSCSVLMMSCNCIMFLAFLNSNFFFIYSISLF